MDREYEGGLPKRGEDEHLTREEEMFIQRFLKRPESFPPEMWGAIMAKVALDIEPLSPSQVQGLRRLNEQVEQTIQDVSDAQITGDTAGVATAENTASGTYTDLATAGPSLTGLRDGSYLVLYYAQIASGTAGAVGYISVSDNGNAASDANMANQVIGSGVDYSVQGTAFFALANSDNNTLTMKYRTNTNTVQFANRKIVALRLTS